MSLLIPLERMERTRSPQFPGIQRKGPNLVLMNRYSIFRRVETGLTAIAAGKFVVVADSADREDEGDLILAAEKATPEALAFGIRGSVG